MNLKKIVLILLGIGLVVFGAIEYNWWNTARQQASNLMTTEQSPAPETYAHLKQACEKLGVNIFEPAMPDTATPDPAEIAEQLSKGINQRITVGAATCLVGFILLVVGFLIRSKSTV